MTPHSQIGCHPVYEGIDKLSANRLCCRLMPKAMKCPSGRIQGNLDKHLPNGKKQLKHIGLKAQTQKEISLTAAIEKDLD